MCEGEKMRKRTMERKGEKKPLPNIETKKAIKDVEIARGIKVKDSKELFSKLGI